MSATVLSLVPSYQRPIPLECRRDLIANRIEYRGRATWVVKDPVGLKYHRLQPEQYCVLRLLNGNRSLEEIRDAVRREFPTLNVGLFDIQSLITDLHDKGLTLSSRSGQAPGFIKLYRKRRQEKILSAFLNILYLRLPGWDPEPTFRWLYPKTRFLFRVWVVAVVVGLAVSSLVLLIVQFDEFRRRLPEFRQFFGWPNLVYMWLTLGAAKVLHEFGHGLTCKHFGGECHEMGVMLLVFSPCLYCDVSDSWMLKNKWKRIAIGAAGMYVEIAISAVAVFVWWNTEAGLLHHLCLNTFFVTTVTTVIFNANPLMRYDGYYMLADWLEIPNLRPKADRMLRDKFAWYCLGIESHPDPFLPQSGRTWFLLFAVAAALYRWFILFAITLFLYTVLKPYGLQSIGIMLAVVSVISIASGLVLNLYRIISAPRNEPMSRPKLTATLAAVLAIVLGVVLIPVPLHIEAPFLVEPYHLHRVFSTTPGYLSSIHVHPGEWVRRGTVLEELSNAEKEDRYRSLLIAYKVQRADVSLSLALDDPAAENLAREKLVSLSTQLDDLAGQLAQLKITAPCDGMVIAAARRPEPQREPSVDKLARWHGTSLDRQNIGCYIDERTPLLSIAPEDRFVAVILIDQSDRNDLSPGQTVQLQLEDRPGHVLQGTVSEISRRHLGFAPKSLTNKAGGDLTSVTDRQGRERLTSSVYEVSVVLENYADLLRQGMRGKARFVVDRRSIGQWIWRYFRQTLTFRL